MTAKQLHDALTVLGWSQAELGRRIATHRTTLSRWCTEDRIPGPVAAYVELALKVHELGLAIKP